MVLSGLAWICSLGCFTSTLHAGAGFAISAGDSQEARVRAKAAGLSCTSDGSSKEARAKAAALCEAFPASLSAEVSDASSSRDMLIAMAVPLKTAQGMQDDEDRLKYFLRTAFQVVALPDGGKVQVRLRAPGDVTPRIRVWRRKVAGPLHAMIDNKMLTLELTEPRP
jgi:hypothetical protein